MSNVSNNVVAGRPNSTGGAYRAPAATALPTDATTALANTYKPLGYLGDSGVTETIGRDTNTIKAWGGDIVKVVQSDFSVTYQITLIETLNTEVNKATYGDSSVTAVAATSGHGNTLAITVNGTPLDRHVWDFEIKDGSASVRIVVPNGQVIDRGDAVYQDSDVVAYPLTIQAFPDASGNNAYKYSDDGLVTGS